ncbi:hypothetical protein F511_36685 [Dorcoceras hygrometricum]|uniref:Uncharacterized protein n=1 Tax=Dorcoceras hygrometricum TaxID=472368 RepID=A0A2Z7A5L6_9LAMI|nr:hypothetical protein F511_36685 [Dorcoceras hygrometricum]
MRRSAACLAATSADHGASSMRESSTTVRRSLRIHPQPIGLHVRRKQQPIAQTCVKSWPPGGRYSRPCAASAQIATLLASRRLAPTRFTRKLALQEHAGPLGSLGLNGAGEHDADISPTGGEDLLCSAAAVTP